MKQFIVALLVGTAMAGASTTGASAHSHAPNHYFGGCNEAQPDPAGAEFRSGIDWVRSTAVVGDLFTGAAGKVVARALYPCTSGTSTFSSFTFIAAANLQGTDIFGTYQFVQTGMAKFNGGGAQCGNPNGSDNWVSDQTTFVFTPGNNTGVLCKAYWFDTNNDGHGDDPIGGHAYKFTITEDDSGILNFWQFCITDLNTGVGDCHNTSRNSDDNGIGGNSGAWWGCEVGNHANAMGVQANVADVTLYETAYERSHNRGVWNYTEDSNIFQPWNPIAVGYTWLQSQAGLGESVKCRTALHGL